MGAIQPNLLINYILSKGDISQDEEVDVIKQEMDNYVEQFDGAKRDIGEIQQMMNAFLEHPLLTNDPFF